MFQLNKKHLRYDTYTSTNIDWIGAIPNGWEVWKLNRLSDIQTGNTPSKSDDNNYSEEGIPWIKPDNLNDFIPLETSKEKLSSLGLSQARLIKKGSILVCGIGTIGKIGIAGCDLTTNQQINSITFNHKINDEYGKYLIFSSQKEMERNSNKVVVSILNKSQQSNIKYPVPPLSEQEKIAKYLDEKTILLEEIIEKRQNQIKLLSEHKTALINNAITKGLDSKVEMKESGVEWLGKVPKHWNLRKLNQLTEFLTCGLASTPDYVDEKNGVPFLSAQNVRQNKMDLRKYNYISKTLHSQLTRNRIPQKGDILITRVGAGIGDACLVDIDFEFSIYVSLTHIRTNSELFNGFLVYFFSTDYSKYLNKLGTIDGGGQGNLNVKNVRTYLIPLPSIKEQKEIVEYLDKEIKYIDDMVEKLEKSIQLMKEYKTSLISHAVSGKIKI